MSQSTADLARAYFEETWNQKLGDAIERFAHSDSVAHQSFESIKCAADFREQVYRPFLDAFPDLNLEVEDVIANGDQAVVRWRATGSHLGDGLGVPASGKSIDFFGMTWLVFRDGKIAEGWNGWDQGGLLQRLAGQV